MPSRRYHVHIICVAHEQPLLLDGLAMFFQARAFLTYDISPRLPQASLYGRQCVDSCDHTVMIVGENYGTTQNLGVSQMHLSYLSAKAKLKPMLVLIKNKNEKSDLSRQLLDFTQTVEQQAEDIHYYDDNTNIEQLLTVAYNKIATRDNLVASWTKFNENIKDTSMKDSSTYDRIAQYGNASKTMASPESVNRLSTHKNPNSQHSSYQSSNHQGSNRQGSEVNINSDSVIPIIELSKKFAIKYTAQAYEGGNLTDIMMTIELTWQQVLQALARIPATFSSYGLQGCMNRLISTNAEYDIKQKMPNVHAVSRCQIAQDDLQKLQRLLITANWIQLTGSGLSTSQELWKLTFYAKNLFKESQLAANHLN